MLHELRLAVCLLFVRAEPSVHGAATAPDSPDPQRSFERRCLCLFDFDLHGPGVLSLVSCRGLESMFKEGGAGSCTEPRPWMTKLPPVTAEVRALSTPCHWPRPVNWCTNSIAPSSRSSLQLAMSRGTTSSASSAVMAGGSMALAKDSWLM